MQLTSSLAAEEAEKRSAVAGVVADTLLQRAEDYIHAHLKESFSLLDLTEAVATSPSTLLRTFNTHHGVSPMQYVKRLRLKAVRRSLSFADPQTTTVGHVAVGFGFRQLGRFSAQYRDAFGEFPSVTLRRHRQPGVHEL
jgi:transcriptional regulator GlxA family with amidase domain